MASTAQPHIERLFRKPAQVVIWDFYYGDGLSMEKTAEKVGVSMRTIGQWMDGWGWPRREMGVQLAPPPRPREVAVNG